MPPAPDQSSARGAPALDLPHGPIPARPTQASPPGDATPGATDVAALTRADAVNPSQGHQPRQGSESGSGAELSSDDSSEHRRADGHNSERAGEWRTPSSTESGQSDVQSVAEFDASHVPAAEAAGPSRTMTPQEAESESAPTPQESEPEQALAPDSEPERALAPEELDPEGEASVLQSTHLEVAPGSPEADDDVHFGVAAKALGVSRKTVERMVKNGSLERGPSGASATVSKRALVAMIEERRGKTSQPMGIPEFEDGAVVQLDPQPELPVAGVQEIQALLGPLLEPLLQELVAVRTQATVLENQIKSVDARAVHEQDARADHARRQNELMLALITGNWAERRKARKLAIRALLRSGSSPTRRS